MPGPSQDTIRELAATLRQGAAEAHERHHEQAAMGRRGAVKRDTIVEAALRLLDREGLEGVTQRRLADTLEVKAPALYWHFRSKQDIVDEMAHEILVRGLGDLKAPVDPAAWLPWLHEMGQALRAALLSRRDGARIVAGAGLGRARALADLIELDLTVLEAGGFEPAVAADISNTIISFVFGYVIEEQSQPTLRSALSFMRSVRSEYPHLARALMARRRISSTEQFERGLALILDGIAPRGASDAGWVPPGRTPRRPPRGVQTGRRAGPVTPN